MPTHIYTPVWDTIDASARSAPARVRPCRLYWMQAAAATAVGAAACSGLLALARGESPGLAAAQAGIALVLALVVLLPCARVLGGMVQAERRD